MNSLNTILAWLIENEAGKLGLETDKSKHLLYNVPHSTHTSTHPHKVMKPSPFFVIAAFLLGVLCSLCVHAADLRAYLLEHPADLKLPDDDTALFRMASKGKNIDFLGLPPMENLDGKPVKFEPTGN